MDVLVHKELESGCLLDLSWALLPSLLPAGFCTPDFFPSKEQLFGPDLNWCSRTFSSLPHLLFINLVDRKTNGVKLVRVP